VQNFSALETKIRIRHDYEAVIGFDNIPFTRHISQKQVRKVAEQDDDIIAKQNV
jgi:hypothetical protein